MSVIVPIVRDSRRLDIVAAVGQTSFSFPRPLFDAADLSVSVKEAGWLSFVGASGYVVTLTSGGATVDFGAPLRSDVSAPEIVVRLEGRRIAARTTDVTRGGALNGAAIDHELDLAAVTLQELRRDVDDAVRLAGNLTEIAEIAGALDALQAVQGYLDAAAAAAQAASVSAAGARSDASAAAASANAAASDLATQLAALADAVAVATAAAASAAQAVQTANAMRADVTGALSASYIHQNWTSGLASIVPTTGAGTRGEVLTEAGSHTDPISGATVLNVGVYRWVTGTPQGWTRIGDSAAAVQATKTDVRAIGDERYSLASGVVTSLRPVRVDAMGNVVAGREAAHGQDVQAAGYVFPPEGVVGIWHAGQSLAGGMVSTTALTTTPPSANVLCFGSGQSSAQSRPSETWAPQELTAPGVTSWTPSFEQSGKNCWNLDAGETGLAQLGAALLDDAASLHGVTPGAPMVFTATCARGAMDVASLTRRTTFVLAEDQIRAFKTLSDAAGKTCAIRFVDWIQGVSDVDLGTTGSAYIAAMLEYVYQWNELVYEIIGQTPPVYFLASQTPYQIVSSQGRIAQAQLDMCAQSPLIKFVTPEWHLSHYSDDVHLAAQGYIHHGLYFARAARQLMFEGRDPDYLRLVSATAAGLQLRLRYRVPTPPIVIDTTTWTAATQMGVRLYDNSGDIALSSFAVAADGVTITATMTRAPGVGATVQVGMDYLSSSVTAIDAKGGANANFRDSTPDTRTVLGTTFPLYHVAPAVRMAVVSRVA